MKHVLIVDDEIDITETFTLLFRLNGFEVSSASNGVEALALVRQRLPDIIISDGMMPAMDGFTFCRRLRELPGGEKLPFILMSAVPLRGELLQTPFDRFLQKPFRFNVLLAAVNELLERAPPANS